MEVDGFEEWDDAFCETLDLLEQQALAATQQQQQQQQQQRADPPPTPSTTTTHPPPQPHPLRLGYAHETALTHSPPRELSQRPLDYDNRPQSSRRTDFKPVPSSSAAVGVAVPPVLPRSSRTASSSRSDNSEVIRLKRELERVSKQLTQREQECLKLRKEREKKQVQLQSATLPKEAISSQARSLSDRDLIVPSQECAGVSAFGLDHNVLKRQETSQFGKGLSSYHTKGVQTEVETDDFPPASDKETASCDSLTKKLKLIRRCSADLYSGSYLVSKLFIVCGAELQVLFCYCESTACSKPEDVNKENSSVVTSVVNDKLICSSDAAKVSRFYTAVTKMSNGMMQFETFYKALVDLCHIPNAVITYGSLRILHVTLLHFAGCQQISTRRDNCAIEATNDVSAFCITDSHEIASHKHHAVDSLDTSNAKPSCIEWPSLFRSMHQISSSVTDEPILYEALSIMNVILKRFGPTERERYGEIPVLQTVPKLLKKEAGLRVQKEAVHLLYLLLNCPTVLASVYSGFKEMKLNSHSDNNGSTFEGLSTIFAGLEDCLICSGTVLEALELRRNAITLVSYLVSFGTSGHEVLWSSTACNKTGFLVIILRLLSSEMDSEVLNPGELTDIVKERALLVREALIFLNRVVSHPTFSGAALRALTTGREVANLTVETTSKLSSKGKKSIWQDDGITKQMLEIEIPNLACMLYKRVSTFLGDNISL